MEKLYNYIYSIRLYLKNSLYEPQILNTTALILYDKSKSYDNYCEFTTDDPHKEFSCIFSNITDITQYIISLFIKIKDENAKENYLSKYIEIETKESSKNKKVTIALSVTFTIIFVLIVIIVIIYYIYKLKRENNTLKERVNQISFSYEYREGNNEDRNSNNDDENSFI